MIVYRYMAEEEMLKIVNGNMKNVGAVFYSDKIKKTVSNSHHYKKGVKYLHFFKNLPDIKFIQPLQKFNPSNMFVCKFNIPLYILLKHLGKGYYETSGYDIPYETIREFAIPADEIKPEFLTACVFDKNRNITAQQADIYFKKFEDKMRDRESIKEKGE